MCSVITFSPQCYRIYWLLCTCVRGWDKLTSIGSWENYINQNGCTLLTKRNAGLIHRFFLVILGHWPWPPGSCQFCQWYTVSGSVIYTLPQKKHNLQKPMFLLGKSICSYMTQSKLQYVLRVFFFNLTVSYFFLRACRVYVNWEHMH